MKSHFSLRQTQILMINGLFAVVMIAAFARTILQAKDLVTVLASSGYEILSRSTNLILSL